MRMTLEVFIALLSFATVAAFTPGPNNLMLLASGVNFGFRRTIPHMLGITIGFGILQICIGLGFGKVLEQVPALFEAIKVLGTLYMIYLAWRIATAGAPETQQKTTTPMSFVQALLFQWVNPKAWVVTAVVMTVYTSQENFLTSLVIIVATFSAVSVPVVSIWTGFGTFMQRFLSNPKILRIFNVAMGLALLLSLWPMLR